MSEVNMKRTVRGDLEEIAGRLTQGLATKGFGILTRIDLHSKFKEKLGKDIKPCVILGACNPKAAFEVYSVNTDMASLIPCNAVLRDLGDGQISVELAKASTMLQVLKNQNFVEMAKALDLDLKQVLESL